jgi:hypothetical protein
MRVTRQGTSPPKAPKEAGSFDLALLGGRGAAPRRRFNPVPGHSR